MRGPELAPHQLKALKQMKNGCILNGPVGSGKSRVALAYYLNNESYEDVYIITTAKKRDSLDWEEEAAKCGIGKAKDATLAGVLTVDSWNNLGKYVDVTNAFFIFDEQRLVGSGAWAKSFIKIAKKNQWILLSATPGDTWLDYIPVFIANGFYKNRTEFKRDHVVYAPYTKFPKVERYIAAGKLVRLKNSITVEMPFDRHTVRHTKYVEVAHDADLFHKVTRARWNVFEERPLRDVAELFRVMRKLVNSDSSRLAAVRELMKEHPRLIVFYNFDYELEQLRTLAGDSSLANLSNMEESCQDCLETNLVGTSKSSERISQRSSDSTESSISKTSTMMESQQNGQSSNPKRQCDGSCQNHRSISNSTKSASTQTITHSSPSQSGESPKFETPTMELKSTTDSNHVKERTRTSVSQRDATTNPAFAIAEWNGHKHEPIPNTDRWVYLVQYVAGSEGWNCISTDAMCFYSLTYSYKNFAQAHGRIDRLNTPYTNLYYYVLMSKSLIDKAVLKSLKNKQNFNESDFYPNKFAAN